MPKLNVNSTTLHYESIGTGPETIVFSHGLLMSGEMFAAQVAAFSPRFRCITFDFRGQGQSEVAASGYDMDSLCEDAAALIETLVDGPVHFAGLSMGGFVGLRLAARRSELLRSLVLLDTSAEPEPKEKIVRYRTLAFAGRWIGFELVVDRVMPILFGKTFIADESRAAERRAWRKRLVNNDRVGVQRALEGVVSRSGVEAELARIAVPTLVIVGDEDVATVPERAKRIANAIAGARLIVVPRAGHSSTIEAPDAINAALDSFFSEVSRVPQPSERVL